MEYRVQKCGNRVKEAVFGSQVLRYPNHRDPYTLTTDASLTDTAAILSHKQVTEERVIV